MSKQVNSCRGVTSLRTMMFRRYKQIIIFLTIVIAWYLVSFFIPYNTLANSLGVINIGSRQSWPLAFFLMDGLVLVSTALFVVILIRALNTRQYPWLLLGILLLYPLITVWATFQDLVFSPIAPLKGWLTL